jgi:hypothetical protein
LVADVLRSLVTAKVLRYLPSLLYHELVDCHLRNPSRFG